MRSLVVLTMACLTAMPTISLAGSNGQDVVRKAYRVADDLRDQSGRLSSAKLDLIDEKLNELSDLINRRGGGGHGGGRPDRNILFRGKIGAVPFEFSANDLGEVYETCENIVNTSVGATPIDDISVSLNFSATQNLRNSSAYWRGPFEICMQFVGLARTNGLVAKESMFTAIGKMQNVEFRLQGNSLMALNRQCEDLVKTKIGATPVDNIVLSLNYGETVTLRNSSAYWRGPFDICQQVLGAVK